MISSRIVRNFLCEMKGFVKKLQEASSNARGKMSYDYEVIPHNNLSKLKKKFSDVWKNDQFPKKQWHIVEKQLANPENVPHFRVAVDLVKETNLKNPSILEIGCSSGYLSQIFKKAGLAADYQGCDYSPAFIKFAKLKYPHIKFHIAEATSLPFKSNQFDIVISGGCLLHIVEYKKAIKEAARVAGRFIIFHRTPILHINPTSYFTKIGYGEKMLEIFFSEEELYDLFADFGLQVINVRSLTQHNLTDSLEPMFVKDYLCLKIN